MCQGHQAGFWKCRGGGSSWPLGSSRAPGMPHLTERTSRQAGLGTPWASVKLREARWLPQPAHRAAPQARKGADLSPRPLGSRLLCCDKEVLLLRNSSHPKWM